MKTRKKKVRYFLENLLNQKEYYLPGLFWKGALEEIAENYIDKGIDNFRREDINLQFFVPTYGCPGNGFNKNEISYILSQNFDSLSIKQNSYLQKSLDGSLHALSDYRTFKAATLLSDLYGLSNFSESDVGNPTEKFSFHNKFFSRSSLNYLLGLTFLNAFAHDFRPKTVLEIGGGFGTLAEILEQSNLLKFKYINLDLPPMFLISEAYMEACSPKNEDFFDYFKNIDGSVNICDLPKFTFLPNWRIEDLQGKIDLFVNYISFQEMEPFIVENYIKHILRLKPEFVLLRNLREGKQKSKKGVLGVQKPLLKQDYLHYFSSYKLLGSNTIPYGYKTVDGFHSELMILKKK